MQSPDIRTPDHRVRVFVSSTMEELAAERNAARAAIEQLRLAPVMFEAGARPHPPQALYRAYLDQSDVFVGIYWQRYGWIGPGMTVSGLEEEFRLSAGIPRLLYLKRPASDLEPGLRRMLDEIRADGHVAYKNFADPEELRELLLGDLAAILAERFASPSDDGLGHDVPSPVTTLVGRDRDVEAVTRLLDDPGGRLVVLTGPGGIGKTRVALAVADRSRAVWNDGVAFIDLSAVTDPRSVTAVIASSLGLTVEGREQPLDTLARRLADRRMLIVLDNFEQVLAAAPVVAELLQRAPRLHMLITSRVALRVRGEREWRIDPLSLAPDGAGLAALAEASAVRLFIDRVRDVRPGFELTDDNATTVAQVCRRLDGLPLAIELAAAWTRLLTPEQILARLYERVDRPGVLADLPDRQQTLTATLEWSYNLLPAPAQRLLARLSVFAGPFTLDAAEAVGGTDPGEGKETDMGAGTGSGTLEHLFTLLDHCMVSPASRPDGETAFRLLGVIQRFAFTRLEDPDNANARLERYLLDVMGSASVQHGSRDWAMRRLDSEQLNIQRVLRWAAAGRRPAGQLLSRIGDVWVWLLARRHLRPSSELYQLIESLPVAELDGGSDLIAWYWLKMLVLMLDGRYARAGGLLDEILPDVRRFAPPPRRGLMLMTRAVTRPYAPDSPARAEFETALAVVRAAGDPLALGYVLSHFGLFLCVDGDVARARALHEEIIPIACDLADTSQLAEAYYALAVDSLAAGEPESAYAYLAAAARWDREIDHRDGLTRCLGALSALALERGDGQLAAQLIGATAAARDAIGVAPWPSVAEAERRTAERVASLLTKDQFREQVAAGQARELEEALTHALAVLAGPTPVPDAAS